MGFRTAKLLKSMLLPGGAILLGAAILLNLSWVPLPLSGVNFFYAAVFISALLLAWRFHSTRVLFCAVMLLMAHHAIEFYAQQYPHLPGPHRAAFEAVGLLIPLNFILLTLFPERSSEGRTLFEFLALLFFESIFVAILSRPDQAIPTFLHVTLIRDYHLQIPQPAMLVFLLAWARLGYRSLRLQKAIESGMFWSLAAVCMGLQAGGLGKIGSAYFGVAAFILASSIVENSYSLAYRDELTGLDSRRAFNEAVLRLRHPYCIAAVDIDHFKRINDTYGHDTGDQVLRLVASRLARVTGGGQPFRVGGEEFTILFPGRTAKEVADHLEFLRMEIESASFRFRTGEERRKVPRDSDRRSATRQAKASSRAGSGALSVTVSMGVAESQPRLRAEGVIQHADKALYAAKQAGRNRIVIATTQRRTRQDSSTRSAQC